MLCRKKSRSIVKTEGRRRHINTPTSGREGQKQSESSITNSILAAPRSGQHDFNHSRGGPMRYHCLHNRYLNKLNEARRRCGACSDLRRLLACARSLWIGGSCCILLMVRTEDRQRYTYIERGTTCFDSGKMDSKSDTGVNRLPSPCRQPETHRERNNGMIFVDFPGKTDDQLPRGVNEKRVVSALMA